MELDKLHNLSDKQLMKAYMDENRETIQPAKWLFPLTVEYNRRKICECEDPQYLLDVTNRIVSCKGCGAILDPFEVLLSVARRWDDLLEQEMQVRAQILAAQEKTESEKTSLFRFRTVRNIEKNYIKGLYPICPLCGTAFDPSEIEDFVHKSSTSPKGPKRK